MIMNTKSNFPRTPQTVSKAELFTSVKYDGRFEGYHFTTFKSELFFVQQLGNYTALDSKLYATQRLVDLVSDYRLELPFTGDEFYFSIVNDCLYMSHQYLGSRSRFICNIA